MFGVDLNRQAVMTVATIACSLLVTLGILSNPDSSKTGYGDDIMTCSSCGETSLHVQANGQFICKNCGNITDPGSSQVNDEEDAQ